MGLVIVSSGCSKSECPVVPPTPTVAPKPSAEQLLVTSRKDARDDIEDVVRRVATLGWRFELRGHLDEVLVMSSMTNLLAGQVVDMCTRKALPSFIDGKFTPPGEQPKWKSELARFVRVECIDAGGIVVGMNLDKAGKWSTDAVPDLTAYEHVDAASKPVRAQPVQRYEADDDDPDRFAFGTVDGFHDAVKPRAAAVKSPPSAPPPAEQPAKPGELADPY